MKKKASARRVLAGLGVLAAITAAYVGATAWTGHRIQSQYTAGLARMQAQLPFLKVVEQAYEKDLWTATSRVTLQFGCEAAPGADKPSSPMRLTIVDHIQHGPLPGARGFGAAVVDTELLLPDAAGSELAKIFAGAKPLSAHTLIGFDGRYDSSLKSPAGTLESSSGQMLNWQGFEATVRGDMAGTATDYELSMPGIEFLDVHLGAQLKLAGLQWRGRSQMGESIWLATGTSEGEIGTIEFTVNPPVGSAMRQPFKLGLAQVKLASEARVEQDLLNTSSAMSATGSVGDTRLDRIELKASIKRLHAPAYRKLVERLMQASSCDQAGSRPDPQAMVAALQQDLMQLLRHNPEYALDKFALEFGGQRGEVSYALGVQGVTAEDMKLPITAVLATRGQIRADLKLPVTWIELLSAQVYSQLTENAPPPELVTAMLEQFTSEGLIERQGEQLSSSLRYGQGVLQVNGKPVPLAAPAAPAAAMAEPEAAKAQ